MASSSDFLLPSSLLFLSFMRPARSRRRRETGGVRLPVDESALRAAMPRMNTGDGGWNWDIQQQICRLTLDPTLIDISCVTYCTQDAAILCALHIVVYWTQCCVTFRKREATLRSLVPSGERRHVPAVDLKCELVPVSADSHVLKVRFAVVSPPCRFNTT